MGHACGASGKGVNFKDVIQFLDEQYQARLEADRRDYDMGGWREGSDQPWTTKRVAKTLPLSQLSS